MGVLSRLSEAGFLPSYMGSEGSDFARNGRLAACHLVEIVLMESAILEVRVLGSGAVPAACWAVCCI